ncbi:MAG TPA: outer membrane beta-barrel protein, partial [Geminicoccaceae bacterium]|nr:outer membrane beta-barrel protein [Geminicoccaceae bacterium]
MTRRWTASTLVLTATAAVGLLAPTAAGAQEPDPNVPVQDRPRPELDPLGIRAGGFLIFPEVTVAGSYNDNIFATPDDEIDDLITLVSPEISVQSQFSRHAINLNTGADLGFYLDENDENFQDYFVGVNGRLDVLREAAFTGGARYSHEHEDRGDPDDVGGAEPTEFDRFGADLGYQQTFNRLNFRVLGTAERLDFDDVPAAGGVTIDNDDRDRNEYNALLRVGYAVSPRLRFFTEGRYSIVDYSEDLPGVDFNRDSDGYEVRAGADIDLTAVLFGEVFAGYRWVDYDADVFDDSDGFSLGAGLTWNVTQLTTIELAARRDVEETTEAGASGRFTTVAEVEVHHELLRNLLLNGLVGYRNDDYEGIDRTDDTFTFGVGATYLMNRYLNLELAY